MFSDAGRNTAIQVISCIESSLSDASDTDLRLLFYAAVYGLSSSAGIIDAQVTFRHLSFSAHLAHLGSGSWLDPDAAIARLTALRPILEVLPPAVGRAMAHAMGARVG